MAVTMPSPEVVWSRSMTWPLFSPPRRGARRPASPRGCTCRRRACGPPGRRPPPRPICSPPFERTETTTPPGSAPRDPAGRARGCRARGPRRRPGRVASIAISRSASPSSAKPTSAPRATTASASEAGSVAPAAKVDVDPVGLGVDDVDHCPGRPQDLGAQRRAGAVRTVEHQMRAGRLDASGEPEPVTQVVVDEAGADHDPPEAGVRRAAEVARAPDELFELVLDGIVELEAATVEHLEPVVVGRVVRGRDHDPGGEPATPCEEGKRGRRHDPDLVDIRPETGGPGRDRRDEHVAGASGVLADDERLARPHEPMCGRPAKGVCEGRLEFDIRDTTDAVGPEQARHRALSRPGTRRARPRPGARMAMATAGVARSPSPGSWPDSPTRGSGPSGGRR